jgi:hypothetical protein
MRAYGREEYDGWAFVDGGNVYSRKYSGRGHGKNGISQKRTDRAMKRRARKKNKIQ